MTSQTKTEYYLNPLNFLSLDFSDILEYIGLGDNPAEVKAGVKFET